LVWQIVKAQDVLLAVFLDLVMRILDGLLHGGELIRLDAGTYLVAVK
jgi:hypothetical protein